MRVDLFDFELPQEAIALRPASPRDSARLLVVPPDSDFSDRSVSDLTDLLAPGDALVVNDTRVIHARLSGFRARGVVLHRVTLHVGAGTFLPVKVEDTGAHKMHAEWGELDAATAEALNETRARGGRVVAVGTTALRVLESAALEDGRLAPFAGETAIFITPGYRFRAVDALLTNFHLPRSTLFMLVCAFCGLERMQAAYARAIRSGYRFYSYGDACLLLRS